MAERFAFRAVLTTIRELLGPTTLSFMLDG